MIPEQFRRRAVEIARSTLTPFYLFDLDAVLGAHDRMVRAWQRHFSRLRLAYSYKTNPLSVIARLLRSRGASAEVVSGAELEWALDDGHPPEDILFDGPVKLPSELDRALRLGVRVQVDSLDELDCILAVAPSVAAPLRLSARLNVSHGTRPSRFGMLPGELEEAARRLAGAGLAFRGVHLHLGSNLNDPGLYGRVVREHAPLLRAQLQPGSSPVWLDLGGGYPAHSLGEGVRLAPDESFAGAAASALVEAGIDVGALEVIVEPGRRLVEDFAVLVTRVAVRKSRGGTSILVVDAGTNLVRSIRTWHHPVEIARAPAAGGSARHDIYGALCFESDIFAEGVLGPADIEVGELVLVGEAGGYDIPSANVWTRPSPPVLGVHGDSVVTMRRAQRTDEVRALEC